MTKCQLNYFNVRKKTKEGGVRLLSREEDDDILRG